jgi:ATP-binding cassette subfamily F protein 3
VLVADGAAPTFDGDLEDYRNWLAEQRAQDSATPEKTTDKAQLKADRAQAQADRQTRLVQRRTLTKEIEQLDKKLEIWQKEKSTLDERLADPAIYQDTAQLQTLLKRQAELAGWIGPAEERWLELHEALEALPAP